MQTAEKVINFKRVRKTAINSTKSKKPKVLFVDDEERILNTMQALFRRQYEITTTTDGYHALELLEQEHFHLLVSDQRMPIMPGVDLLRKAKDVSPDTVRILLTGFSDLAAIIGSVNDGEVFRFLNKPWKTEEFVSTVDEAVKIGLELQQAAANDVPELLPKVVKDAPNQTDVALSADGIKQEADSAERLEVQPKPALQFPQAASIYRENIIVLHGDDEMLVSVRTMLPGCQIFAADNHDDAIALMMDHEIGVIVSNVDDDHEGALVFFSLLKREHPQVVSILLANNGDSETLIHLINNARVFRYMFKPIRERLMGRFLNSAIEQYHKFKVAPTLLKQQAAQEKAPEVVSAAVKASIEDVKRDESSESSQSSPTLMGKMRKIRSFFSKLVSG